MMRALASPARVSIVKTLTACGGMSCMELTRSLGMAQSTVSEHLRVLKDAGLVEQAGPGLRAIYRINHDGLAWMKQAVASLSEGPVSPTRVLFLCTGNSARSILAEAALRHVGGDRFDVHSAGTDPKGINPWTLRVLGAAGISTEGLDSKNLSRYLDDQFDYVITVCDRAAEQCPVFPGDPERIHWSLPDPAAVTGDDALKLAAFTATLDDLRRRIEPFAALAGAQTTPF